ncbi:MAG: hypothetical protein DME75_09185 [Verrucomicrobia bacterium]|nr:MAG: hypothetical protein DME75_09185 [Verrucomicrobiota bacterium]HEU0046014.1 hypothetical protein [Nitrososphaera sp.]
MLNSVILFRCYSELLACRERVAILRELNPDVAIYGLYGGEESNFRKRYAFLGGSFDDIQVAPHPQGWEMKVDTRRAHAQELVQDLRKECAV